jgi:hypothetical protein
VHFIGTIIFSNAVKYCFERHFGANLLSHFVR